MALHGRRGRRNRRTPCCNLRARMVGRCAGGAGRNGGVACRAIHRMFINRSRVPRGARFVRALARNGAPVRDASSRAKRSASSGKANSSSLAASQ
eukprot:15448549-Alexandrium_andersonii.AAC.1